MTEGRLQGVGVVVTRGEKGDGPLSLLLRERGAKVLDWGSIGFAPPEDLCPLFTALVRIRDYDWICFSSPRAVSAIVDRMDAPPEGVRFAAIGPSTAGSLEEAGWPVHRVSTEGHGEGMVKAFRKAGDVDGAYVFFPASAIARNVIPEGLEGLGARVDRVTAYRTVLLPLDAEACRTSFRDGEVQVITFASPSAMDGLRKGLGEALFGDLARSVPAAAMGPTTAGALREAGWADVAVAESPTMESLVDAAREAVTIKAS